MKWGDLNHMPLFLNIVGEGGESIKEQEAKEEERKRKRNQGEGGSKQRINDIQKTIEKNGRKRGRAICRN